MFSVQDYIKGVDKMAGYPKNNKNMIYDQMANRIKTGIEGINNNLQRNLDQIDSEIKKIPVKYTAMKNELSLSNEREKRRTEELIANTGSNSASGYAMSKRMNNLNAFNKNLNELNIAKINELSGLENKKRELKYKAGEDINKLIGDSNEKLLDRYLSEDKRYDDMMFEREKLEETKRINDSKIEKTDADIIKINKDVEKTDKDIEKISNDIELDKRDDERKQKKFDIESEYLSDEKKANLRKIDADIKLIEAKTDSEASRKKLLDTQSTKTASSGSGRGGGSTQSGLSKMTPLQLAENINKQTGTLKYTYSGSAYYEINPSEAYKLLMELKRQFNLSAQVVNDTAIHLGIQDKL